MKKVLSKKVIASLFIFLLFGFVFILLTKGNINNKGQLLFQKGYDTVISGPFELSNTTARYALTESLVESKSFFLNKQEAIFSAPDVTEYKGKYFSIFTPGVSFLGVPFYSIGKAFGVPQLSSFWMNTLIMLIDIVLVSILARKLGSSYWLSIIGGFLFGFATNAFVFTFTFTQHPLSTMLILLAILNSLERRNWSNNLFLGIIYTAGLLVDIPNGIMMLPVLIYALSKNIGFKRVSQKTSLSIKKSFLMFFIATIPLIALFAYYNYATTGSYTKLAQNIGRSETITSIQKQNKEIKESVSEVLAGKPLLDVPFHTRDMLNGFYILLLSDERSWIFFSPVILLGIGGLIIAYKNKKTQNASIIVIAIIGFNVVLYSMFGDPWGGWSYGARYLIPSSALLAASTAVFLNRYGRKLYIAGLFTILLAFSLYINTLGAYTTNALPPKNEALSLQTPTEYTFKYNQKIADTNKSSSLLYNALLRDKVSLNLAIDLTAVILVLIGIGLYIPFLLKKYE